MKITIQPIALFAAVVALFALTGCNTVSSSHTQDIGAPRFAPTDPAQVQILRTEPTQAHVRLGQVRAEPSSDNMDVSKIEAALRTEAAKLGANAAVVVSDNTQVTGAMVVGPLRDRSVEAVESRVVVAVAIRYQ